MTVDSVLPAPPDAAGVMSGEAAVARIVSRLSGDYVLRAFQLLIDVHGDIRLGLFVVGINAANVAHIDGRTEEGRRAAASEGLVRDEMRKPINVDWLADLAGLPRDGTRQIVQRLVDAGLASASTAA